MGLLSSKLRHGIDGYGGKFLSYYCQGCKERHDVYVERGSEHHGPVWGWDGDAENPTLTPSVLVTTGHYCAPRDTPPASGSYGCWCTFYDEFPAIEGEHKFKCGICHTFITDGQVQFLSDCTHEYAGQTLPLPDIPPYPVNIQEAP